jgi:hypothetical protein
MPLLLPPLAASTMKRSQDYPVDLIRYSRQVEAAKAIQVLELREVGCGEYYGAQLDPWRDRDLTALAEVFDGEDLESIDADVSKALKVLWPEPCWEDNWFETWQDEGDRELDFLSEFL